MHALSFGTWWIHLTTLFEWILAIVLLTRYGISSNNRAILFFALAMIPNLASAMAAITWHLYDNPEYLYGLVVFQAALTVVGNTCLAVAAWNLVRTEREAL